MAQVRDCQYVYIKFLQNLGEKDLIMKALFRKNMFLADSDSINNIYNNDDYIKKFKSALLMSKSIGVSPNMMIDSQGFKSLTQNQTIIKFFEKRFLKQEEGEKFNINIHIFNNYIEHNYFHIKDNSTDNPFMRYYHEKMNNDFILSSFQNKTKYEIEHDHILKKEMQDRLIYLDQFTRNYFNKYKYDMFNIVNKNEEKDHLKTSILKNAKHIFKEIRNDSDLLDKNNKQAYQSALKIYIELITNATPKNNILTRSSCYDLLKNNEMNCILENLKEKIKVDLIDTTYNSRFIGKEDIYRYKNSELIDNLYNTYFDSYVEDGKIYQLTDLYQRFDKIKSKFEIINLALEPTSIFSYIWDEIMSEAEDKGLSLAHRFASIVIPKTGLLGISESKNLLIGTSNEI